MTRRGSRGFSGGLSHVPFLDVGVGPVDVFVLGKSVELCA